MKIVNDFFHVVPDMLPTLVEVKNGAVTELVMISSLMASTELICGQVGTTQYRGVPVTLG
jgi:hypothetical protein